MPDHAAPSTPTPGTLQQRARAWLFGPEDAGGLAVYRIFWGGLMAWEAWRYLRAGWVHKYYIAPNFLFKYIGFEWVQPLPGNGMIYLYWVMFAAGIGISLGFYYRFWSTVYFVTHTWAFLSAAANYLNHAYLIALLAFVMIWLPADRALSIDAWRKRVKPEKYLPRWPRALMLTQLGIVYTYGGIAKINTDWLVYHQPVRRWMGGSAKKLPWIAETVRSEPFTQMVAYGGCLFDLFIVPALIWKRTRPIAVLLAAGFHLTNSYLFSIGVFPWLMLAATTLFFEPDWVRRIPKLGKWPGWVLDRGEDFSRASAVWQKRIVVAASVWLAIQVLVPLRHHLYPGHVAWNEDGHYCSWRMKLRSKRGTVKFRVVERDTDRSWIVDPKDDLSKRQARKIRGKPELIRQYANHLVERYREEEGIEVDVYVDAVAALNYRPTQRFIDPDYELGHEPASYAPYHWVTEVEWVEPPHPGNPAPAKKPKKSKRGIRVNKH